MYLRTTTRRNKDGSEVSYLQLAHNEWDTAAGHSVVRVVHNFGRADRVDREAIARLVASLSRLLGPGEVLEATASDGLSFVDSRPVGGVWVLDQLWRRLGIDTLLTKAASGRRLDPGVERVLFALVANRALEPLSKLAATTWVAERVAVPGLDSVDVDACYRSMDWLSLCRLRDAGAGVKMGVGCPRRRRFSGLEAVPQSDAGARPEGSRIVATSTRIRISVP